MRKVVATFRAPIPCAALRHLEAALAASYGQDIFVSHEGEFFVFYTEARNPSPAPARPDPNKGVINPYIPSETLRLIDQGFIESGEQKKVEWLDAEINEAFIAYDSGEPLPSLPKGGKFCRTLHIRPETRDLLAEAAKEARLSFSKFIGRLLVLRFGGVDK